MVAALGLVGAVLAWRAVPAASLADRLAGRVASAGVWGAALYVAAYALGVVLLVPGSALTLVGGLVYGPVVGSALVSIASTLGASASFVVARTVGRRVVRARVATDPRFAAVDRAVADRGAWVVFLLRLSPLIPFNLLNYALGLTGVGFAHYVLASWAGMLPGTVLFVMIGASFGPRGRPGGLGPWYWAATLAATLAATVYVGRVAKAALQAPEATK